MTTWLLRGRAMLNQYLLPIVITLILVAALGGWLTYTTYVTPGVTVEERSLGTVQTTGTFTHHATVTNGTTVFTAGEQLTNRTVYFTDVSPILNSTYHFSYKAPREGALTVRIETSLVLRSVLQNQDTSTSLWETTTTLATTTKENLTPQETVSVPLAINVSKANRRLQRINQELGGSPGQPQLRLQADVHYAGQVSDHPIETTKTYTLPLSVSQNTYRVDDPGPVTTDHSLGSETITRPRTYGPTRRLGGPLLLSGALIILGGLLTARAHNQLALSPSEREHLTFRDDRADFDEWITRITLPDDTFNRPQAKAESLADLVDFAIDNDTSVIEDPTFGAYFVIADNYLYTYIPPNTTGPIPTDPPDTTTPDDQTTTTEPSTNNS